MLVRSGEGEGRGDGVKEERKGREEEKGGRGRDKGWKMGEGGDQDQRDTSQTHKQEHLEPSRPKSFKGL